VTSIFGIVRDTSRDQGGIGGLVEKTGDQRWPLLVNSDRNLSRLVLDHLDKAIEAYDLAIR